MYHLAKRHSGFTLVELLVVIGIIALLAAMLLPVISSALAQGKSARCKNKLRQLFTGLRTYQNNFDDYIPAALHISATTADLGGYHYHRFAVHEYTDLSFSHVVSDTDTAAGKDAEWKFGTSRIFWQCPAQGYTQEYFGPEIAFRLPGAIQGARFDGHAQNSTLTAAVPSTERPILTDVDASYAHGGVYDEGDCKSTAHYNDVEGGWRIHGDANAGSRGIFIGVGDSLRTDGDYGTERFDFRHNGACNVLYLDQHVAALRKSDGARLKRVHDRWNDLRVTDD
jgi:prepilin-type N-terminal cleavage/methylation domain-containing protein/prepilin-type processing-associated H-X9-DG protein